jgi:hypothetical protein
MATFTRITDTYYGEVIIMERDWIDCPVNSALQTANYGDPSGTISGTIPVSAITNISSITPAGASVDGYLTVVLTSAGGLFVGVTAVTVGGIPAVSYVVDSPYQITAVIPNVNVGFNTIAVST